MRLTEKNKKKQKSGGSQNGRRRKRSGMRRELRWGLKKPDGRLQRKSRICGSARKRTDSARKQRIPS